MRDIPEAWAIKKITEQATQKTNSAGCRKVIKKLIKYISHAASKGKTSTKLYTQSFKLSPADISLLTNELHKKGYSCSWQFVGGMGESITVSWEDNIY